jgi:cathepsin B
MCAPWISQSDVDAINNAQSLWTAEISPRFANKTEEEIRSMFGVVIPEDRLALPKADYSALREFAGLPDSFDSRDAWPSCKGAIRDQGQCGSCWAFGAVEAFDDRRCIASKAGKVDFSAPQALVDCDTQDFGCGGGWPEKAWEYMRDQGLPTESCYPYKAYDKNCNKKCSDGKEWSVNKAKTVHTYSSTDDVKTDIQANGPVETWFAVYQDFLNYHSGIYAPTSPSLLGYHAVEVLGWGVENGVKYWIAANSWAASWGDKGYFKIKAGTCQFDDVDHFVAGNV